MSDPDNMQELFKQAAKIAEVVPTSMQEAAFHRALDLLVGGEQSSNGNAKKKPRRGQRTNSTPESKATAAASKDNRAARVTAIPRDAAPEVDQESNVLGRSIALLVVASREAGVDGLTAPEIATILTEKFRHRTTRQAVGQALETAGNKVDRQKSGNGAAVYRVMRAGEEWLSTPAEDRPTNGGARTRRRSGAQKAAPRKGAETDTRGRTTSPAKNRPKAKAAESGSSTRSASAGRRAGPKAMLQVLIEEGFFATARDLTDIRRELRDQKALSFESTDLSPALTRLLREQKLRRSKTEKQYVYTAV